MSSEPAKIVKARYYSSVTVFYLMTLLFGWYIFNPVGVGGRKPAAALAASRPAAAVTASPVRIIFGKPVRIEIPYLALNLPIDEGFYKPTDNTWTLSANHAQFAMSSTLANDHDGNTFIYGHDSKYLFGHLKYLTPGAKARLYTDNGYVFSYIFQASTEVIPDDTSILDYQGPPIMTIQTCSGSWFEKRQMFKFTLDKVTPQ